MALGCALFGLVGLMMGAYVWMAAARAAAAECELVRVQGFGVCPSANYSSAMVLIVGGIVLLVAAVACWVWSERH